MNRKELFIIIGGTILLGLVFLIVSFYVKLEYKRCDQFTPSSGYDWAPCVKAGCKNFGGGDGLCVPGFYKHR